MKTDINLAFEKWFKNTNHLYDSALLYDGIRGAYVDSKTQLLFNAFVSGALYQGDKMASRLFN